MNDFHYGLSLLDTMFGIEMEEEDYEETALVAYRKIGNKRMRNYRFCTEVNECSEGVELPCNVDELEAVTVPIEEWAHVTNDTPNGDFSSARTEAYIENRKMFRHPMYIPGKYIKYERVGDKLYFDHPHGKVLVLYRGEELDDNGLPMITDAEALALATFCAYVHTYKEALKDKDRAGLAWSLDLFKLWTIRCDQARVADYMNQNDWDLILDAKTSWARKVHNQSHKIYQ